MKKFNFTLQSWYEMQTGLEKQYKLHLRNAEAELARREKELEQLVMDFNSTKEEYCGAVAKGVTTSKIKQLDMFFESIKAAMAAVQADIVRLERERDQWMQKLVHTRKEIKLLDKLRESQFREYQVESKKQNDKFVDDLVSYSVTVS